MHASGCKTNHFRQSNRNLRWQWIRYASSIVKLTNHLLSFCSREFIASSISIQTAHPCVGWSLDSGELSQSSYKTCMTTLTREKHTSNLLPVHWEKKTCRMAALFDASPGPGRCDVCQVKATSFTVVFSSITVSLFRIEYKIHYRLPGRTQWLNIQSVHVNWDQLRIKGFKSSRGCAQASN